MELLFFCRTLDLYILVVGEKVIQKIKRKLSIIGMDKVRNLMILTSLWIIVLRFLHLLFFSGHRMKWFEKKQKNRCPFHLRELKNEKKSVDLCIYYGLVCWICKHLVYGFVLPHSSLFEKLVDWLTSLVCGLVIIRFIAVWLDISGSNSENLYCVVLNQVSYQYLGCILLPSGMKRIVLYIGRIE